MGRMGWMTPGLGNGCASQGARHVMAPPFLTCWRFPNVRLAGPRSRKTNHWGHG